VKLLRGLRLHDPEPFLVTFSVKSPASAPNMTRALIPLVLISAVYACTPLTTCELRGVQHPFAILPLFNNFCTPILSRFRESLGLRKSDTCVIEYTTFCAPFFLDTWHGWFYSSLFPTVRPSHPLVQGLPVQCRSLLKVLNGPLDSVSVLD